MSKVRVSALAKELGIPSKEAVSWLTANGEYVKSAASTIEAPVERKLREAFPAKSADGGSKPAARSPATPSSGQAASAAAAAVSPVPTAPAPSPTPGRGARTGEPGHRGRARARTAAQAAAPVPRSAARRPPRRPLVRQPAGCRPRRWRRRTAPPAPARRQPG